MKSQRSRLDRFIARHENISLRDVRGMIAQGRVQLDGERASSISQMVGQFSHVTVDNRVLQDSKAHYVILHKPAGVVSATRDQHHRTVVDLLHQPLLPARQQTAMRRERWGIRSATTTRYVTG